MCIWCSAEWPEKPEHVVLVLLFLAVSLEQNSLVCGKVIYIIIWTYVCHIICTYGNIHYHVSYIHISIHTYTRMYEYILVCVFVIHFKKYALFMLEFVQWKFLSFFFLPQ